MFGAMKIASSRLSCIIPALKWAIVLVLPYGRLEDVVVADVDLVLAGGRLALAELDRDPGLGHLVAEEAVERLGLRCLKQVVVLVVVAEPLRDAPALAGRLVPRLA